MSGYTLSYEEHAAIYSAALLLVFRATKEVASCLVQRLPEVVYRRVVIYCAGLCLLRKYQTCFGMARQLGGCSHDALNRLINSTKWTASQLMVLCLQTALTVASGTPQGCWLIVDDVILPKAASKKMLATYWDYDYVQDKYIRCLRLVVVCWTNGLIKLPVAWALWHKKDSAYLKQTTTKFRTKNELARLLVYVVQRKGLPFDYLLFDSWYAGAQHLAWYHRRGIRFVTATKNNRTIRRLWIPLSERPLRVRKNTQRWSTTTPHALAQAHPHSRDYHYYPTRDWRTRRWEITLEGCSEFLSLVCIKNYATNPAFGDIVTKAEKKHKDPNKYLLTNDPSLTVTQIVEWYRRRWAIENTFKAVQQAFNTGKLPSQRFRANQCYLGRMTIAYTATVLFQTPLLTQQAQRWMWTTVRRRLLWVPALGDLTEDTVVMTFHQDFPYKTIHRLVVIRLTRLLDASETTYPKSSRGHPEQQEENQIVMRKAA